MRSEIKIDIGVPDLPGIHPADINKFIEREVEDWLKAMREKYQGVVMNYYIQTTGRITRG